ncbi:MAG: hypothetical protein JWM98_1001, partial [Thermoleophilia bacterium]|nr:hypothetical protein [Thermoleophilia bacterium]
RVDSVLSFDWGNGAPARGVPSDNFSARWSGTLRAPKAGRYRFWATADDGVRLQVGAKRVLLDWHEHAAKTTSGVVVLRRGVRSPIRLDYYEAGGGAVMRLEWQPPGGKRGPIPASLLTPDPAPAKPAPPTTGLVGTYYDETNMTKPIVQRLDPEVRFDWNRAQPDPEMYPDTYSVRWTGSVTAPVTGAYRLATRADDGTRLFVDGQPIVDDWTVHGARWKEGVVQLEAGHSYDIELQYYQGNGGAEVQLAWTPPGGARTVIPTQYLAPRPPSPEPMTQPVPAPPAVPEPGLWGVYHDEEDFTGRMYGRTDAQLAMHWKGQPHPSIDRDTFSVRWTGSLAVPLEGDYRLVTDADDGVRVWLDGQPLIDRWTWRSPSVDRSAAVHLVPGRRYDLRVDQHDGAGDAGIELRWTSARIPEQPIPTWALMTPGEVAGELALPDAPEPFAVSDDQLAQPGLLGLYWDDLAYLQPKLARVDATVDGRWGTASPAAGMGRDEFAVRWLGSVVAPRAGAWRFHVTADDGLRLWVCGRLVLDAWKVQGASEYTSEPINLTPGAPCAVRLDYFEQGGEASVKLAWSAADQPKQVIPATALRPPTRAELGPLWWWAGT